MVAVAVPDASLCAKVSPNATFLTYGRATALLRSRCFVSIAYNTRDDTVPWVRRLTTLMREADSGAMRGDFGADSVERVAESPYFGLLERRNFRNWTPITREGLISMGERRPSVARLDPAARSRLVREVGALYNEYARVPDPLMLPYQTSCWRAEVDHSKLVIDDDFDDVLQIKL